MSRDIPDTIVLSECELEKLIKLVLESEGGKGPKAKKDIKLLTPEEAEKVMKNFINKE